MKPRIFEIDPLHIDLTLIEKASDIIHNRGLVAFPTETVYGLGANALDPKAVAGIFEAKKRPFDDPLIVHIADVNDIYKLAKDVPDDAQRLVTRFWPGPLTLILKKTDLVPDIVTTGLDTVGIRMPSNPVARKFIEVAGTPIAAPSANLFGRPSPTTIKHVIEDLDGRIDAVLDGGSTEIGIESTVVEFFNGKVEVLRPGGISLEELRSIVEKVEVSKDVSHLDLSPGKYPQHYSPEAKVLIAEDDALQVEKVLAMADELTLTGKKTGLLIKQEHEGLYEKYLTKVLGPENDFKTCASRLFRMLRDFDSEEVDIIIAEAISEKGLGLAIMNRLRKAAGPDF